MHINGSFKRMTFRFWCKVAFLNRKKTSFYHKETEQSIYCPCYVGYCDITPIFLLFQSLTSSHMEFSCLLLVHHHQNVFSQNWEDTYPFHTDTSGPCTKINRPKSKKILFTSCLQTHNYFWQRIFLPLPLSECYISPSKLNKLISHMSLL